MAKRPNMKPAIAAGILRNPKLGAEERQMALILLQFADNDGVIRDTEINELIDEAVREELFDHAPRLPRNRPPRERK